MPHERFFVKDHERLPVPFDTVELSFLTSLPLLKACIVASGSIRVSATSARSSSSNARWGLTCCPRNQGQLIQTPFDQLALVGGSRILAHPFGECFKASLRPSVPLPHGDTIRPTIPSGSLNIARLTS